MKKQPGAEGIAKVVRLKKLGERGEVAFPVFGLIRNCQRVFPFKLESPEDIKIVPVIREEPPNVIIRGETGEITLTAEYAFEVVVGSDANKKPIFLTNLE